MINALLSFIDRLIRLTEYRNARLDKRFDDLFELTFDDLLVIHTDYIEMFETTKTLLPKPSEEIGSKRYMRRITRATEYLRKKRRVFEPVRVKIRALAMEARDKPSAVEEKQFFNAILNYFPPASLSFGGPSTGTTLLQCLAYFSHGDTVRDAIRFFEDGNGGDIRDLVDQLLKESREKWSSICEAYAPLKVEAASRK